MRRVVHTICQRQGPRVFNYYNPRVCPRQSRQPLLRRPARWFSAGGSKPTDYDLQDLVRLLRLAADQGHAEAQCGLGDCYRKGEGVERRQGSSEAIPPCRRSRTSSSTALPWKPLPQGRRRHQQSSQVPPRCGRRHSRRTVQSRILLPHRSRSGERRQRRGETTALPQLNGLLMGNLALDIATSTEKAWRKTAKKQSWKLLSQGDRGATKQCRSSPILSPCCRPRPPRSDDRPRPLLQGWLRSAKRRQRGYAVVATCCRSRSLSPAALCSCEPTIE